MGNRFDRLPTGVQKLVKRLADLERKELEVLRDNLPDEEERVLELMGKADAVVGELFCTKFAMEELGVCYPDSPDDLMEMGEYFLGEYALDRLYAEEYGEQYSEDLFYAGAYLKQSADVLADAEFDAFLDEELDNMNEFELNALLSTFAEERGSKPVEPKAGRLVSLFEEKKDKKN